MIILSLIVDLDLSNADNLPGFSNEVKIFTEQQQRILNGDYLSSEVVNKTSYLTISFTIGVC